MAMTHEEVRTMALSFPQTEEAMAYGRPAFKCFGKFLTRLRTEDASLVLYCTFDEREMFMEAEPETFHLTPHYKDYPCVLARIGVVDPGTVRGLLERRWRACAPKTFLKQYDAAGDRAGARP